MYMWLIILLVTLAVCMAGLIYLATRFMRFFPTAKWGSSKKWLPVVLGIAALTAVLLIAYLTFGVTNMIVIVILLAFIWILCDVAEQVIRRARKGHKEEDGAKKRPRVYITGFVAIGLTILYLICGYYQAHHIWEKDYRLTVDSNLQPLKIAMIADSHMGTTFHADRFAEELDRIEARKPDLLVVCGDMIDDGTSFEDMTAACEALGRFQAPYGVFFVYGNHDKGYSAGERGYGGKELEEALLNNGVRILEDEVYALNDEYTLIGRADASSGQMGQEARKSIADLVAEADPDSYKIVLDHQPNDYDAEEAAGVNLVLSGHTHGGQMFPINRIGELIGANDSTYGYERHGKTDYIVTSGIGSWAIRFKTGCRSEYVMIDLVPEK